MEDDGVIVSQPQIPDLRIGFQLAADAAYQRMTEAMVNAIAHYHPDARIRLYVPDEDRPAFARLADLVELCSPPPLVFNHGSFHPLIWSKLEAARATDVDVVVVLDPDQIMYRPLHRLCAVLWASTADFGACTDNEVVAAQFRRVPRELDPYAKRPGISSGTMLIRPSPDFYEAYVDAARRYAADALYPDQSVLAILAYTQGRWLRFEEELQLLHFSPSVLNPDHGACLVHLYTPRPPWCGSSPRRPGEPDFIEACAEFKQETGQPYPEARLREDFLARLHDRWAA
mgnify:CR=1 FL=1